VVVGGLALVGVGGAPRDVALERGPKHQRARRLVECPYGHQHAAHVRMHDDRVGGFFRKFRAA
jgi:hypothetical protein